MRIAKWDNLKFVLIYFVVLGHMIAKLKIHSSVLESIHLFIYLFHMPAFMYISGLFAKRSVNERKINRAVSYLILYFFMVILQFVIYSVLNKELYSVHLFTENGVPWFALTLFLYYLTTMLLQGQNPYMMLIIAILLGCLAGYDKNLGPFLTGMRYFTFYPFFYLGYLTSIDSLNKFTSKKTVKLFSVIVLCVTITICYLYRIKLYDNLVFFKGSQTYTKLSVPVWGGVYRAAHYVWAFMLTIAVISIIPNTECILTRWGRRSIQVFALHYPLMVILLKITHLKSLLVQIWPSHYGILVIPVAFVLTVVLSTGLLEPFFRLLMHTGVHNKDKA